ncbi:Dynein light chain [Globisporangium polare]
MASTHSQQQRLHRTANNVVAATRVAKSSYCDHAGWASKQGSIIKSWKRRYFVLKGRELIYFAERSPSGKGIDEKGRLKIVAVEFTPEFTNGLLIKGELKNQSMKIQVETNQESAEWYAKIKEQLLSSGNSSGSSANGSGGGANGKGGSNVTMQGWLFKEGQNFKTWKKRYMTLSGRVIKYHAKANEAPLGEAAVNDYNINPGKSFALDIFSENNRIFRIAAESFADIEAWDQAIAKAIGKTPCFGDPYADQKAPFLGETFNEANLCEGWLYKRGQRSTAWKKRFFTLTGFQLQYQENPGDNPKGEGSVVDIQLSEEGSNSMEIQLDNGRVLSVSADSKEQLDIWVNAICTVLDKDPATIGVVSAGGRASLTGGKGGGGLLRRGLSLGSRASISIGQSQASISTSSSGGDGDLMGPRKTGWLKKQGKNFKSWKRRFFIVEDCAITYFEQLHEAPLGSGFISQVTVNPGFPNCLDIILTTGRVLRVSAESPDEIRAWLIHISDIVNNSDPAERGSSSSDTRQSSSGHLSISENLDEPGKGWLMKKGKNFKTWKRRYFVLEGKKLSYSANVGESPLGCGLVSYVTLGNARPFCIDVRFQNGRILNVAASNEAEMITWCKVLQASMRSQAKAGEEAEFDFDDNEDDSVAEPRARHSIGGVVQIRTSLHQQALRSSLGNNHNHSSGNNSSSNSLFGRSSSLDSDESYEVVTPYVNGMDRMSLDENLPGCSGYLRKEGSTIKNWKLRYFTLNGTTLSYFKSDNGPLIKTLKVCHVHVLRTKKFCLEVTTESGRKLLIAADSNAEYERWLAALHQAVSLEKKSKKESAAATAQKIIRL